MIPHEYIEELVARNDITDVVQGYVQLRHRGRTYTGLCPFHNEKTPSFVVYPETQSFYCFGCGAGGDVITFMKRISNLEYVEAVKALASRVGMPLPEETDAAGKRRSRILSINKDAARFFFEQLNSDAGREARGYWRRRGLSDSTIRRFGLGYAPNSFRDTRDHMRQLGYSDDELIEAGLIRRHEKGHTYDVFRNRVMVPIFDLRGNVIAFGGRNMGDEKPKYLNSPETLAYKKSRTLFAMNIAKRAQSRKYILCEGYMDVISMHQAGFSTAVAGCGTALTSEQVKILSEYADEVVLCYDSDEAGQKATARALSLFANSPVKVSVLNIPDAKDPDEFIQKYGRERFEMLVNGSASAIEYALVKAKKPYDITTPDGRLGYIRDAVGVLAGPLSVTEREVYAGRLAEETDVTKQAILAQVNAAVRARARRSEKERERRLLEEGMGGRIKLQPGQGGRALGVAFAEQQLIGAVIKRPEYFALAADTLREENFLTDDMRAVFSLIRRRYEHGEPFDLASLSSELAPDTVSMIGRILAQNYELTIGEQDVRMYIDRILGSAPESSRAAQRSPDELAAYLQTLREKKS